ncbi:LXG domain-containing protein [Salicibibacter cibarius]|uniref:LXG domain-containing protein n=1 Tax=Salicibibacter cibarius TaxID=2743000 RepID=A0A7T6Z5Y8_9BACI|nr:T7SS effector LXG polymorphic toxin [Salicibibacter cibarius]QQK77593.1 LXG domain-containing protein [Salicibibacter cibarius]
MILDTEELIETMSTIVQEIDGHKNVIETIKSNVEAICNLESLQGEGGSAIKDHFTTLHLPVLTMTHHFIETYKGHLEQVRNNLFLFDSDNALVRFSYLEDVKADLHQVIQFTQESADTINASYNRVSDLVGTGQLDISSLIEGATGAKDNIDDTEEALLESDEANHVILNEAKQLLIHFGNLVNKVEGWIGDDVELSPETLKDISAYFQDSQTVNNLMDDEVVGLILERLVEGDNLTDAEQELVYHYIQNEIVDQEKLEEIVELIDGDEDDLMYQLNQDTLASEATLDDEIAMIEAYLHGRNLKPKEHVGEPEDDAKLSAYLAVLNNYKTAISEVKEELDREEIAGPGNPLFARVEYLEYEQTNEPYAISFNTGIAISLTQYDDDPNREKFLNMREVLPGRLNESEVTYYMSEDAANGLQYSENEELEEEYANYTENFISEETFGLLISQLAKRAPGLSVVDALARYESGKNEKEDDLKIGNAKLTAMDLDMEIQISDRFVPGPGSNQLEIQLHPTDITFDALSRWEEVHNINPDIPYPATEIEDQDWYSISEHLTENRGVIRGMDPDLYSYIFSNKLEGGKTVEELAGNH